MMIRTSIENALTTGDFSAGRPITNPIVANSAGHITSDRSC